jgi:alpha-glucosidase
MPWRAAAFREAVAARDAAFGPERWPANVLSNHDQPRHASRFAPAGADASAVTGGDGRAKVAATMLLTLRGTPFLYYGEEIALRNLSIPNAEAADPPARRASLLFPWWNRDQARGPMPWTGSPGAGFSTGRPWLPLAPDAARRNVGEQSSDRASVLSTYRDVLRLRRATPALREGSQDLVDQADADVLSYLRVGADGLAFVALSFASRPATISVPAPGAGRAWRVAFSTTGRPDGEAVADTAVLAPLEALVATA